MQEKVTISIEIPRRNCKLCGSEFAPSWTSEVYCSKECKKKVKAKQDLEANRRKRERDKVLKFK